LSVGEADLGAEQEVDLRRYWHAVVVRWWLPLVGLIAGALVGYLISLGGGQVWKASSSVYLGTSYSTAGGVVLQGPQANPATVGTIARSEDSIDRAAAKAGMRAGDLRGKVSTQTISTGAGATAVRTTGNPLVRITAQASTRRRAQVAANALAGIVVDRLAPYADAKITNLKQRIAADKAEIADLRRGVSAAADQVTRALLAVQLGQVVNDQLQAKSLLIQAQQIERPQVLTRAAAVKTTARSRRNSVLVGAFIGLLIGLAAALVWERAAATRAA
jgi:hypothetical protein